MFLIKKDMTADFNMSHEKMVCFSFISLFLVQFSHKTEKFWFLKTLKYFDFFDQKVSDLNIPVKHSLIWFKLRCLSRILVIK